MKNLFFGAATMLAIALSACSNPQYSVTVPIDQENGTYVYLTNIDTKEVIDSCIVQDKMATFNGIVEKPFAANIRKENHGRYSTLIVEKGQIVINDSTFKAGGTALNIAYNAIQDSIYSILADFRSSSDPDERERIYEDYEQFIRLEIEKNIGSPIGYMLFMDYAGNITAEEIIDFVECNPELKDYQRVQKLYERAEKRARTSEGMPFVDFAVTYDGKTEKLSDYVAKGNYCLVDFWASWCGPCRREIPVIKEIYNKWHDKGLDVLGVAVWDEPDDTLKAIEDLDIPWPCMINAQRIPTDEYGIPGIPCIILFGPDGMIVSRDARGDKLKDVVDQAMASIKQ